MLWTDQRFYRQPQPEDINPTFTYKSDNDKPTPNNLYEIIDGVITVKHPVEIDDIYLNNIKSRSGVITIDGKLVVDVIETNKHIQITSKELITKDIIHGDLTINGDFNVSGNVNWSGKTKYVDTEIIRAEDNIIYLNHKGNHETSKNGGIRVVCGVDKKTDSTMIIDKNGYWTVFPGLNVESINFTTTEDNMIVGYVNGTKVGIPYKTL